MAHLAQLLSQCLLLYLQHIKKGQVLLIRSDGLQKPKLPAFDSWPLICQFITGESEIFSFGKTQHILRYKCPSSINKHQETELWGDVGRTRTWLQAHGGLVQRLVTASWAEAVTARQPCVYSNLSNPHMLIRCIRRVHAHNTHKQQTINTQQQVSRLNISYFPQTVSCRKSKKNGRVSCDSVTSKRNISTILHHTKLPYDKKQLFLFILCLSCVAAVCAVITSNVSCYDNCCCWNVKQVTW